MVLITFAYTAPVNPSGTGIQLNKTQVWDGLMIKTRHGDRFVPVIEKCEVVNERTDPAKGGVLVVTRDATFKPLDGSTSGERVIKREECFCYPKTKVVFVQEDGTLIENCLSSGADGELYLTYSFEWLHKDVEDHDQNKIAELNKRYLSLAKMAVHDTIETLRNMVENGEIKD